MGKQYKQLTFEERERIYALTEHGESSFKYFMFEGVKEIVKW